MKYNSTEIDRPVTSENEDEYGFSEMAQKLAPNVIAATKTDGMVIGIEGKWGSGKTSLLNLLIKELQKQEDDKLHIHQLPPWLHGNANELIDALFAQMLPILENEQCEHDNNKQSGKTSFLSRLKIKKHQTSRITKTVSHYVAIVEKHTSPVMRIGGLFFPHALMAETILKTGTEYFKNFSQEKPVIELKKQIADFLEKSQLKFVILLDDLDRLEPSQTSEVIRLVRSVADFPSVVYCMCYDRDILSHALETKLHVKNGDKYLQKIVQQTFKMPLPEPFDLRLTLRERLTEYFVKINNRSLNDEENSDLSSTIGSEGVKLEVPRDVVSIFNAVKFNYNQVKKDVYFPDVCWIQMVRLKRPKLYRWIEAYLSEQSAITHNSAYVSKNQQHKMGKALKKLLPEKDVDSANSLWHLNKFLPSVQSHKEPEKRVFNFVEKDKMIKIIDKKRIASPYHSKIYFSYATPKTHMSDIEWGGVS